MALVLGLTGSIGMGKTTTAALFRARGVPVHDADAAVHALYGGASVAPVEAAFPGVAPDGRIDRALLGARVLSDPAALKRLEAIVHPLVRAQEEAFLAAADARAVPLVVLDIPLLLETGGQARCHAVIVVSAPPDLQRARVLARPGMSEERFAALLARQMPDADKRRRAHAVIDTGRGLAAAERQIGDLIRAWAGRAP